jgi:hypothetical protein
VPKRSGPKTRDFGHMDSEVTFSDSDIFEYYCNENEKDRAHMRKKQARWPLPICGNEISGAKSKKAQQPPAADRLLSVLWGGRL